MTSTITIPTHTPALNIPPITEQLEREVIIKKNHMNLKNANLII